MGLTIVRRVEMPLLVAIRVQPRGKSQRGAGKRSIILIMETKDPGEIKELLAKVNEESGRKYTYAEVEKQLEARIKGRSAYPSFRKKVETGSFY